MRRPFFCFNTLKLTQYFSLIIFVEVSVAVYDLTPVGTRGTLLSHHSNCACAISFRWGPTRNPQTGTGWV